MDRRVLLVLATSCAAFAACAVDRGSPDAAGADTTAAAPAPTVMRDSTPQSPSDLIDPSVDADSISDAQRFIAFGLRRVGSDAAALRATFGAPDSTRTEAVQNRHDPARTDSIVHLFHPSAGAVLYRTNGRDLLMSIDVRDDAWLRLPGPRIGMSREESVAFMGEPHEETDGELRWSCRVCVVEQQLVLRFASGRVSSIGFSYYVD